MTNGRLVPTDTHRPKFRFFALAFVFLGCPSKQAEPVRAAAPKAQSSEQHSAPATPPPRARPQVAPEPQPPLAARADEIPKLEAELAADKAYAKLWDPKKRGVLRLFLTAVSELLSTSDTGNNAEIVDAVSAPLEKAGLLNAAVNLYAMYLRGGALPPDFEDQARAFVAESKGDEHGGLWKPESKEQPFDITGLAVLLAPQDPQVLRERLAAKRLGPFTWAWTDKSKAYLRPYLVSEKAAVERLAVLSDLTPAEVSRLEFLCLTKVGDAFTLGEFRYVVTGVRAETALGNSVVNAQASEGALYVLVEYTIENLGTKTATVTAGDLRLIDLRGREFRPSSDANAALALSAKSRDVVLAEVQPGLKRKMVTVFEVPIDVTTEWFKIVVPEKGPLGTGKVVLGVELRPR